MKEARKALSRRGFAILTVNGGEEHRDGKGDDRPAENKQLVVCSLLDHCPAEDHHGRRH
jgi:hypothetical protein